MKLITGLLLRIVKRKLIPEGNSFLSCFKTSFNTEDKDLSTRLVEDTGTAIINSLLVRFQ